MSTFAGNVLKLVTGSVFAQGLGVLVAPIVARLFAPEAFGVAALFASIAGIIGVVACLRYELSIMLPKTDEEAANLLGVSLFFVLIITGISALIIFFAGDVIVGLLNSPELKKYLWMIPVAVFLSGTFLALNYWNSRTKHFGRLSIARVISSVVAQTTKLGAGFAGFVSGGVLIGTVILGQFVSTVVLGGQIWRDDRHLFKANIQWKRMIGGVKRHRKFPAYSTWSALLNKSSQQLPLWFLAFFFSAKVVGFYSFTYMLLSMPTILIGGAISQVFFQKATYTINNRPDDLPIVVERIIKRLVCIAIYPIPLLMLIGKDVFIVILGDQWGEAGIYAQILGLWVFLVFITSPISTLFYILKKQKICFLFDSALFATRVMALIAGGLMGSVFITLILFSASGSIIWLWMYCWLTSNAGVSSFRSFYPIIKYIAYCLPILSMVAICKWVFDLNSSIIVVIGCLAALLYYGIIWNYDIQLKNAITSATLQFIGKNPY